MDLLRAEIDRKRKATEELKRSSSSSNNNNNNNDLSDSFTNKHPRYIRQKDVLLQQQKEREELERKLVEEEENIKKQQQQQQQQAHSSIEHSSKSHSTSAHGNKSSTDNIKVSSNQSSKTTGSKNISHKMESTDSDGVTSTILKGLSLKEIYTRLRGLRQPITLFGESNEDRIKRLEISINRHEQNEEADDIRHDSRDGVYNNEKRNSLDEEDGLDDDDDDNDNGDRSNSKNHEEEDDKDSDDEDEVKHDDGKSSKVKNKKDGPIIYSQIPNYPPEKIVYKYFKGLLKQWELDLNEREDRVKLSAKGKMDTKNQKRCKDYMRPLMKMLKKRNIDTPDILLHLVEIVRLCEEGNFRLAHEEYLRTAIGNAAWPIGLTMVGIHERSGRERISTAKIAHVMNNEQQRKYLTSVRSLMTYAQTKRPDIPPSMKVL